MNTATSSLPGIAPGLMLAAPGMPDVRFAEAVLLMVQHDADGALGFVVNQTSKIPLVTLLEHLEDDTLVAAAVSRDLAEQRILIGGPVQPNSFWIIFEKDAEETLDREVLDCAVFVLSDTLAVVNSFDVLDELVRGDRPGRFHVVAGYAGWGASQLEDELKIASWLPVDLATEIVFDTPMDERWAAGVKTLGLEPGGFIMSGSGGIA